MSGAVDMGARFVPTTGVHARRFEEEVVILDLAGGAYYGLDEVGAYIWERLAGGATPHEITAELVERYEADDAKVRADVQNLTQALVERGLVVPRGEP